MIIYIWGRIVVCIPLRHFKAIGKIKLLVKNKNMKCRTHTLCYLLLQENHSTNENTADLACIHRGSEMWVYCPEDSRVDDRNGTISPANDRCHRKK